MRASYSLVRYPASLRLLRTAVTVLVWMLFRKRRTSISWKSCWNRGSAAISRIEYAGPWSTGRSVLHMRSYHCLERAVSVFVREGAARSPGASATRETADASAAPTSSAQSRVFFGGSMSSMR